MVLLVSGFLSFLGFLFAGLLALAFTALLDRQIGKEIALFIFTILLFVFTLSFCRPPAVSGDGRAGQEKTVPAKRMDINTLPYECPDLNVALERNPFRKHSDTRPLEPVEVAMPPWLPLPFQLPPTIPGPAPGARRLLVGDMPEITIGDGSTIPEPPDAVFGDYEPVADDVYDWIVEMGRKTHVYILSINHEGRTYREKDEGYLERVMILASQHPGWKDMKVEIASIGGPEAAARFLEPTDVLKKKRGNISTSDSDQYDEWHPRRSVEFLYREALQAYGLKGDPTSSKDIASLRGAAAKMAEVGKTGKEDKEGWKRAALLLETALGVARQTASPATRSEILEELVAAYVALRSEQEVLRVLTEYARTSPTRPEPWLWLGRFHLLSLGMPEEALLYFDSALEHSQRHAGAWIGKGDALAALGRHEDARVAYGKAGTGAEAKVALAEALIRTGDLGRAEFALASAASASRIETGVDPRLQVALGALKYAAGDLEEARDAFAQAAGATSADSGPTALEYRAQACYDLGLTCWRLGQADAALAAFDACERALQYGSTPGRFPDETVSPSFGRALVAIAAKNEGGFRSALSQAREEAPTVSYHEVLAGIIASMGGDDAAAVRAFERATRLVQLYPELDGWLAKTRLKLGQLALDAGTPLQEATEDFVAAVAFAHRASLTETALDPKAYHGLIREAWILLDARHMGLRQRFDAARMVANKVLAKIDREQPAALSIRGYSNYRLGQFGIIALDQDVDSPYDPCIRDWQLVLDKVPPDSDSPWMPWRDYAEDVLGRVKHWLELEEKLVAFDVGTMAQEWELDESKGVRTRVEESVVRLDDDAGRDGTLDDPIFVMRSKELFKVGTFEEVRLKLRIPTRNDRGDALNTITFGVQVQRTSRRGGTRARYSGLGIFYDRGKIALRFGGGQEERWKDGQIHRNVPEKEWPTGEWVEIRIVRLDDRDGRMQIWLDADPDDGVEGELVGEDTVSGFKGSARTPAELWIGGFSPQAQQYFVEIKDIRVIRRK